MIKRLRTHGEVDGAVAVGLLITVGGFIFLTWRALPLWMRHAALGVACGALILAAAFTFSVIVVMGAFEEATKWQGRKMTDHESDVAFGYGVLYTFLVFLPAMAAYVYWARHTHFFDV